MAAHRPEDALRAFDRSLKSMSAANNDASSRANVAHGQALAWKALGNFKQAVSFEEEAVRLAPDRSDDWLELAGCTTMKAVARMHNKQENAQQAFPETQYRILNEKSGASESRLRDVTRASLKGREESCTLHSPLDSCPQSTLLADEYRRDLILVNSPETWIGG